MPGGANTTIGQKELMECISQEAGEVVFVVLYHIISDVTSTPAYVTSTPAYVIATPAYEASFKECCGTIIDAVAAKTSIMFTMTARSASNPIIIGSDIGYLYVWMESFPQCSFIRRMPSLQTARGLAGLFEPCNHQGWL